MEGRNDLLVIGTTQHDNKDEFSNLQAFLRYGCEDGKGTADIQIQVDTRYTTGNVKLRERARKYLTLEEAEKLARKLDSFVAMGKKFVLNNPV